MCSGGCPVSYTHLGTIWNALNETEGMTAKQLKKATKLVDKDLFLGLGWL